MCEKEPRLTPRKYPRLSPPRASGRAREYLISLVAAPGTRTGSRLPTISSLARIAGVSLVTMWKAVGHLREQGILHAGPRKGIFVASRSTPLDTSPARRYRGTMAWQRLAACLRMDLLAGHLTTVPSVKELLTVYGVGYRTLKKALDSLVETGEIVPRGRGYARKPVPASRSRATVLVFVRGDRNKPWLGHYDPSVLRVLEHLLSGRGCRPVFVRYHAVGDSTVFVDNSTGRPFKPPDNAELLGCLWLVVNDNDISEDTCRRLLSLSCPVAMINHTSERRVPAFFQSGRQVRIFAIHPHDVSAERVASRLLSLGHRHVAYFSVHFAEQWARQRYEGLARVVKAAAPDNTVTRFSVDSPGAHEGDHLTYDYSHFGLKHIVEQAPLQRGVPRELLMRHVADTAEAALQDSYYLWRVAREMELLCVKALRDVRITAWVGAADYEALAALSFLNRKRIAVPDRISVVGFNNSVDALRANLSSYSTDIDDILTAMVEYVIRPEWAGGVLKHKVVTFDGSLVERGSIGPAARGVRV